VSRLDTVSRTPSTGSFSRARAGFGLPSGAALLAALAWPAPASAHGVLSGDDPPLPFWLLGVGSALVLAVSFAVLARGWRRPRWEDDRWRPLPARVSGLLVNRVTDVLASAIGVLLLAVTVWSGFEGTDQVGFNFSVTFVFVTVWLGAAALSVVLGDVFRAFNPWRALARGGGWALYRITGRTIAEPVPYPERLGRWPAVLALVAFVWLELSYGVRGLPDEGIELPGVAPETVALATVFYSLYTFVGMAVFGVDTWLRRGEALSVYFGMFAGLAPLEVRDGTLGRRRWLSGAARWSGGVPGSAALVLTAIGLTIFDDARDALLNRYWIDLWTWLTDAGVDPLVGRRLTSTILMAVVLAVVAAAFRLGLAGMRRLAPGPSTATLAHAFAHCFIPIAFAFLVAHYFSFFVQQIQAQVTYLASDPLGRGWDLFGAAAYRIDFAVLGEKTIWFVQVAALVLGHALALVLAHDRALTVYASARDAVRSQYAMLALMVGFTLLALTLISEIAL
jgi:hypothetical protein